MCIITLPRNAKSTQPDTSQHQTHDQPIQRPSQHTESSPALRLLFTLPKPLSTGHSPRDQTATKDTPSDQAHNPQKLVRGEPSPTRQAPVPRMQRHAQRRRLPGVHQKIKTNNPGLAEKTAYPKGNSSFQTRDHQPFRRAESPSLGLCTDENMLPPV